MDFLKALMLYLSFTFASTVQSAPLPTPTPEPTPAPTAVIAEATPEPTAVPTIAPTAVPPTAAPTQAPAKPQITANPSYKVIRQGAHGNEVKKLQARLIELGYLKGEADGAYGGKTRAAVLRFQEANGLQADGVVGKMTLTVLYEYDDVVKGPYASAEQSPAETAAPMEQPTVTPLPTATPIPLSMLSYDIEPISGGNVVVNDAGKPLTLLRQEDGVTVSTTPRLYSCWDGSVFVSLQDLFTGVEDWTYEEDGKITILNGAGYTIRVDLSGKEPSASTNNDPIALDPGELQVTQDDVLVCRSSFLDIAMQAETVWDDEEKTLMIHVTDREIQNMGG